MTRGLRLGIFGIGAIGFAVLAVLVASQSLGEFTVRDRYARAISTQVQSLRNVTDAVTAINFDFRGFDTLGEEFILFVSVMGAVVLLRQDKDKEQQLIDAIERPRDVRGTDALHVWILAMVGPKLLLGLYIVAHGQLTPGGGFQGGVVIATSLLIVYLGEDFELFKKLASKRGVEIVEAIGVGMFALVGCLGVLRGQPYLANVLPLGKTGEPTSGGTIPLINLATAVEVSCGFVLLMFAFLQETLSREAAGDAGDKHGGGR